MSSTPTVTIAHDYFTQRGGAERVAKALIDEFRPERVVTGLINQSQSYETKATIETSFLQRFALFRRDARIAFPLLPAAWALFRPATSDILLCSSSGWAHSMKRAPRTRKIVYCHNPARWLYQSRDYFRDQPKILHLALLLIRPILLRWDRRAAMDADLYVCNSHAVAERVYEHYGIEAEVVPPPVSFNPNGQTIKPPLQASTYFLTVGRGRGYKNVAALIDAFSAMPTEHLVIVGSKSKTLPPNVSVIPYAEESELRWLYANAEALISVAHEDFGLTPLEANLMGTPCLVLKAGGFLDSVQPGVNGSFINDSTPRTIKSAVENFPREWNSDRIREHGAEYATPAFKRRMQKILTAALNLDHG